MERTALRGKIQTVLGPMSPEELGVTLPHEHCLIDMTALFEEPNEKSEKDFAHQPVSLENLGWVRYHPSENIDNLSLLDEQVAIEEVSKYKQAGGESLVDVTSIGLGRNPSGLARISRRTGVNIVMGTGYYVRETVPPGTELTEEALASRMVDDILDGAEGSNIRSGIIGEIGMEWPTGQWEKKVLRAAAKAQNRTGAAISIHLGRSPNSPFDAVHILRDSGADLNRVVLCHIERTVFDMDRIVELAETGCYIGYDTFSIEGFGERVRMVLSEENPVRMDWPGDPQRVEQIASLVRAGVTDRILISSDMCRKHRLWRYGGPGYGHILRNILPLMRERGLRDEAIHRIVVENPKRLLTFA